MPANRKIHAEDFFTAEGAEYAEENLYILPLRWDAVL